MKQKNLLALNILETEITIDDARKAVQEMNLIDGFLFDSSTEDEEDAKVIIGVILRAALNRNISNINITSQKNFQAIDTKYHGIRMDAYLTRDDRGDVVATVYDIEIENRPSDKASLPKRLRFYNSLSDTKLLGSGKGYENLPDYISITILSYDPFDAGDIYYEARSILTTHPHIEYQDGVTHIYLYCNGRINDNFNPEHGKHLAEVLKYIVSGEKPSTPNTDINTLDTIVSKIKHRAEVTTKYMQQWDRERIMKREWTDEVTKIVSASTKEADALKTIRYGREDGVPDSKIRLRLERDYDLTASVIDSLFDKVNSTELTASPK